MLGRSLCLALLLYSTALFARPGPQWEGSPPQIREWFQNLKQPDSPWQSCCGEADAFEVDDYDVEGDHYIAIITDGRDIIPNGTRIPVPNKKIKWDAGNPTGHGIIFLSSLVTPTDPIPPEYIYVLWVGQQARILYCFVPPGGV
jgi:hypothetical protein